MLDENVKEKKKIPVLPILGILLLIGGIVGIFFFRGDKEEKFNLKVEDSKLYPKFSEDIEEYILYTNKDEIKVVCPAQVKLSGCNKVIKLKNDETEYIVKSKDKEYKITIYKLEDTTSNIKISSVLGNPTEWVKSAELEVQVENPTEIDELSYSFDGGETWQKGSKYKLTRNGTIIVVVKDYFGYLTEEKEVIVDKIDSINPKVKIVKTEENGKIVLTAEAEDTESGIKSYLWNNGSTENKIIVDKKEIYTIEVEDKAGNKTTETIDLTSVVPEDKNQKEEINNNNGNNQGGESTPSSGGNTPSGGGNTPSGGGSTPSGGGEIPVPKNKIKAKFIAPGSEKELECETYTDSCKVTAPQITRSGYEIIGWSKNSNSQTAEKQVGQEIIIRNNDKYYSVTRKRVTVTFTRVDTNASTINIPTASCYKYNGESSCKVTLATITPNSGFTVLGWSKERNKKQPTAASGAEYNASESETLYTVTRTTTPVIVAFNQNGAQSIGATIKECYKYNGETSCKITSPAITPKSGFTVLGWNTNANGTSATWEQNKEKDVTANGTYNAITRSSSKIEVTFNIASSKGTISKNQDSCYRYNGESSCKITSPKITPAQGYTVVGWNTNANATTSTWSPDSAKAVTANGAYHAILNESENTQYTATFVVQDENAVTLSKNSATCTVANGQSSCEITAPKMTSKDPIYGMIGFNTNRTAKESSLNSEGTISINSNVTYYTITRTPVVVTFMKNGAQSVSDTTKTCYKYNGELNCKIKLPTITPADGFEALGWSVLGDSTTGGYEQNREENFIFDTTFYAITKSTSPYTATFRVLDNNAISVNNNGSNNCYRYNGATSCKITTPSMTPKSSKYEAIGWSTTQNSKTKSVNANTSLTLTGNKTYYSVTKDTTGKTAVFNYNPNKVNITASSYEDTTTKINTNTAVVTCYTYNGVDSCKVKSPKITGKTGVTIKGWDSDDNSTTADYQSEGVITLDVIDYYTFYNIFTENITITFHGNDKASFVEDTRVGVRTAIKTASCTSNNGKGCTLKDSDIPLIVGEGREHWGFTKTMQTNYTTPENTSFNIYREVFKSNTDVYILTSGFDYAGGATMISEKLLGNVVIEYDNRINLSIKNAYVSYLDNLYNRWPEMFKEHGKLVLLESNRYGQVAPGTGGMTYMGNTNSLILIPISASEYYDYTAGTMVHELGHAFDNYYGQKLGISMADRASSLYNKYLGYTLRPMKAYAFKNQTEMVAEMFAFKYTRDYNINYNACTPYDWDSGYQYTCSMNGYDDIEKFVNYYICVSRNNYNEEASECRQYK